MVEFVDKLIFECFVAERVEEAIVLTNAATETRWAQLLGRWSSAICMLNGRVPFYRANEDGEIWKPTNGSLQGQMVWYLGIDPAPDMFGLGFAQLGQCFWR